MKRLLLTILFLLCAGQVWAGTYITTGANAGTMLEDSYMDEKNTATNYGTATTMKVGEELFGQDKNMWLDCPSAIDSISSGSMIDSLIITLKVTGFPINNNDLVKLDFYSDTQATTESGITWAKYDGTTNWTVAGGDGVNVQNIGLKITKLSATDLEIVQAWDGNSSTDTTSDSTVTFHVPVSLAGDIFTGASDGIIIKNNIATNSVFFTFGSTEHATSGDRPTWSWYYSPPAAATYKTNQANAATLLDDADLQQGSPTVKNGKSGTAVLAENPDTKTRSFIIRGNNVMDSIGADSTIDSCFVDIVCSNNGTMDFAGDTAWYDLYGLTQDWVEDSVSFDSARTDVAWTTPGGTKTLIQSGYLKLRAYDAGVNWESTIDTGSGAATIMDSGLFIGGAMRLILPHALSQGMYDSTYTGLLLWPDTASMSPAEGITINTSNAATLANRITMEWWATTAPAASLLPRRRRILTNE